MAKVSLNKSSENEPLNKKMKTVKLDDQQNEMSSIKSGDKKMSKIKINKSSELQSKDQLKSSKLQVKDQSKSSKLQAKDQPKNSKLQAKEKIDKSSKLKASDQPKSDELKVQRQLRRQKKKLDRLNKKKNQNKNQNENQNKNQSKNQKKNQNENNQQSKKNPHLSIEERLQSIIKQENVNSKTIINHYKNLVAKLDSPTKVHAIVKQIKQLILDENLNKELKNYLVNDLNRFINHSIYQQNQSKEQSANQQINESLLMLIKFIALNSLFSKSGKDDNLVANLEQDTINCFKNSFIKAITLIICNSTNKKKKEVVRSRLDLLYQVMKYIYSLINNEKTDHSNENYNQIFKKISNSYKQIQLKEDDKQEQSILSAFFLFYVYLSVSVFDEQENCMQILDEVNECFKRFTNRSSDNNELHWADVFTDIILSLLSTASNLKRAVSDEVFSLISKEITKDGLAQLMTALISDELDEEMLENANDEMPEEINEQSENDEEMSSDENEFEDAKEELDDQELSDENIDLDVDENCSKEFAYKSDEEQSENEEQSSEESDNNQSDTESIDDEFRRKIKDALGKAAVSEDEDDEIVFDDEQMFKFDEAIAQVFKEKKKLKSKTQELTEFKSRCFDLVQILLNKKDIDLSFLIEVAKNTLQVLAKNNNSKSFDLIFKASSALKMYQTIEHSKDQEEANSELNELLKTSLNLIAKLPEKVRNNLNYFVIWLFDVTKSNEIDLILNDLDKKLKKSSEISLFIQLAERKKHLAEKIFKRLLQVDLKSKLKNSQLLSYYKLMTACSLNQTEITSDNLKTILNNSLDILNMKKNKGCRVLVEELIRFLTIFIKNHSELVKKDGDLVNRLIKLGEQAIKIRLSKKLRHKLKITLKTIN